MMNRLPFEAIDHHLKFICDNQNAFGGNWSFSGEGIFRQTLSVITHRIRESIVAATLHPVTFWNEYNIMHLHINMRLQRIDESNQTMRKVEEFA